MTEEVEDDEDPVCGVVGRCEAPKDARGITNCIHCGKELHEKAGEWWTYDADNYPDPQSQGYVAPSPRSKIPR